MNKKLLAVAVASSLGLLASSAHAAADASVTTAITAFTTGFTDNFTAVAVFVVGIVVTVTAFKMAINYFRRSAK